MDWALGAALKKKTPLLWVSLIGYPGERVGGEKWTRLFAIFDPVLFDSMLFAHSLPYNYLTLWPNHPSNRSFMAKFTYLFHFFSFLDQVILSVCLKQNVKLWRHKGWRHQVDEFFYFQVKFRIRRGVKRWKPFFWKPSYRTLKDILVHPRPEPYFFFKKTNPLIYFCIFFAK